MTDGGEQNALLAFGELKLHKLGKIENGDQLDGAMKTGGAIGSIALAEWLPMRPGRSIASHWAGGSEVRLPPIVGGGGGSNLSWLQLRSELDLDWIWIGTG